MKQNKDMMKEPILPVAVPITQLIIPTAPPPIILGEDTDTSVRKNFIRKVYSVVWLQLLVTSVFIGICNQVKPVSHFMLSQNGQALASISMVSILVMTCMLFCSNTLLKGGLACIYTTLFTLCMTYMVGIVGVIYSAQTLLLGGISTLGIFSGLTLYAWQTKYDYTVFGNYLLVILFGLIVFGFFGIFIPGQIVQIVYSSTGAVIFSFYIIYDTQLIVGGNNRRIQYSVDDYPLAAINLYLDIINLFLMILDLLSGR